MLLLLIGCHGPKDDTSSPPDTVVDSTLHTDTETDDTDTDPHSDTAVPPFDCGEVPDPPALPTTTWSATPIPPASSVTTFAAPGDESILYAGSVLTGAWRSMDLGGTWQPMHISTTHTLGDIVVSVDDPRTLYRSSGGALERSDDAGETWRGLPLAAIDGDPPRPATTLAMAPYDAQRLYGTTQDGHTWLSTDGGESWEDRSELRLFRDGQSSSPWNTYPWTLLPDVEPDGRVLLSDGQAVYHSDDGLETWLPAFYTPVAGRSLIRDPSDPDRVFIGSPGGILRSLTDGELFTPLGVGQGAERAAFAPDGSWVVFADDDTLWVSERTETQPAGETFVEREIPLLLDGDLWIGADGRLLAGHNDGVAVSWDRGETWEDASIGLEDPGISVVVAHPVCPNVVFAASRCGGGLYRSTDWGSTWAHDPEYLHYVMGLFFDPSDARRLWAVSDDSLLRSDDSGLTWTGITRRYHYHGFAVDPDDPATLLLGSVGSGEWADTQAHVYRSVDGGENFDDASVGIPVTSSSAHAILHWPGNPDVVLLGFYRGGDVSHTGDPGIGLYRSTDRGLSWALADLPELDIAWLTEGAGGVVAATGGGLWRSTDEGVTWERLEGPTGPVVSVDLHGDVGVAAMADTGAWISIDGGEAWTEAYDGLAAGAGDESPLGAAAIDVTGRVAWVTNFGHGVMRRGL